VDTIKIDRSFISKIDEKSIEDIAIIRAILHLSRSLGIKTIAEGVETTSQAATLAQKHCDEGQGYLFGRPMSTAQVAEVLFHWDARAYLAAIRSGASLGAYQSA
jgi:EAL domain-containing protein (putative c-di-GMP-specific phosphodiesterase class I)